jgi:hypothetical protein
MVRILVFQNTNGPWKFQLNNQPNNPIMPPIIAPNNPITAPKTAPKIPMMPPRIPPASPIHTGKVTIKSTMRRMVVVEVFELLLCIRSYFILLKPLQKSYPFLKTAFQGSECSFSNNATLIL